MRVQAESVRVLDQDLAHASRFLFVAPLRFAGWFLSRPPSPPLLSLCLFPSPLSLSPLLSRGSSVEKATTCDVASDSALDHWPVELCPALGCLGCLH